MFGLLRKWLAERKRADEAERKLAEAMTTISNLEREMSRRIRTGRNATETGPENERGRSWFGNDGIDFSITAP